MTSSLTTSTKTLSLGAARKAPHNGRNVRNVLLSTLLCGSFLVFNVTDANAQRSARDRADQQKASQQPTEGRQFNAKTGEIVNEALTFITAEQYAPALSSLNKALALPDLNPYERSTINQMKGRAHYELSQFGQAIQSFENAIGAGGLLPNESSTLRVNIAQLLIANGQPARGAQMLEDWNRSGGQLKPKHIEYLWQAWSQAENYSRALPWAEKWFNAANPKERKHYDLLNFMYNNLNMPGKQADIAKQMIQKWPNDKNLWDVWKSLLANGGREQESFEVTKMLYLGGALKTKQEMETVVQYYGFYEMPYQAAKILEREMNAGTIPQNSDKLVQLSNLWRQAREYKKAIPALEKAAASSGDAKLYADLGEALYKEGKCDKAEVAFKQAMDKGYDRGKAWMLIASCRYDDAALVDRPECPYTEQVEATHPWSVKRTSAEAAFDNVPSSSSEGGNSRKWKKFIAGERSSLQARCKFIKDLEWQNCREDIKRAYKSEFLGGFKLADQSCEKYIPRFDKEFRKDIKKESAE